MDRVLIFDYYDKDELCSHCEFNYTKKTIKVENYVSECYRQAFGKQEITFDSIDWFFRDRCFPETRVDCKELCEMLGVDHFDAEAICRKTHGKCFGDFNWIKFEGEDIKFLRTQDSTVVLEKDGKEV